MVTPLFKYESFIAPKIIDGKVYFGNEDGFWIYDMKTSKEKQEDEEVQEESKKIMYDQEYCGLTKE